MSMLFISKLITMHIKKTGRYRFLNDSLVAVIVGLLGGVFLYAIGEEEQINSITKSYVKVFIVFLLPPIIFEASYNMKTHVFYRNFGTILIYAVFGTLISIIFIGYFTWKFGIMNFYKGFTLKQSVAYGSIISATDPVCILAAFKQFTTDPNFFLLVFGESILNDAVSMVFYDAITEFKGVHEGGSLMDSLSEPLVNFFYILIGSTFIGMGIGLIGSLIIKKISDGVKRPENIEVGILITFPFFSYLLAEVYGFSSIVVIFFEGVSFAMYTKPFITKTSEHVVHEIYENIVDVSESIVFIFIGIAFLADHPYEDLNYSLPLSIVLFSLVARAINIGICSVLANWTRTETTRIDLKKQFFLWFAGVRGAMAFALALKSKFDYPGVGSMFLLLTLILTLWTLVYSSFLLEDCLHKCNVIVHEGTEVKEDDDIVPQEEMDTFNKIKSCFYGIHEDMLLPMVLRRNKVNATEMNSLKRGMLEDFKNEENKNK